MQVELPPLSLEEAEAIHAAVMEEYPEELSGVLDRGLLASALLRPTHAAEYANADEYGQAATLLWGLSKPMLSFKETSARRRRFLSSSWNAPDTGSARRTAQCSKSSTLWIRGRPA